MDAPQSPQEIQPVVEALKRLDPRLDIRWNTTAIVSRRGEYDAQGRLKAPVYDGRWEVVCYESPAQTAPWRHDGERPYQRVCLVTQPAPDSVRGVPALLEKGPYAPVGPWLVDYLRAIDQANAADLRRMAATLDAETARTERAADTTAAEAGTEAFGRLWDDVHRAQGVAVFHPVTIDLRSPATPTTH